MRLSLRLMNNLERDQRKGQRMGTSSPEDPETIRPDTIRPDQEPETIRPDTIRPDTIRPDENPDTIRPDTIRPDGEAGTDSDVN